MSADNFKYTTGSRRLLAAIIDRLVFIPLAFCDNYMRTGLSNKVGLIFWLRFTTAFIIFYYVFMHHKFGQTLGKMVANVKVVSSDETRNLTIKEALMRDSFYILMEIVNLLYFIFEVIKADLTTTAQRHQQRIT